MGQRFSSRDPERGEPESPFASTAPRASPIAHHSEAIQSLSGWDGVFHWEKQALPARVPAQSRNPFQGGMGFFTDMPPDARIVLQDLVSQSLSGWDGVFHHTLEIQD